MTQNARRKREVMKMSDQHALAKKYEHQTITCPVCHGAGQLYFRMQHGRRLWCVRHGDTYHHIGVRLPIEIIDELEGKKRQREITEW